MWLFKSGGPKLANHSLGEAVAGAAGAVPFPFTALRATTPPGIALIFTADAVKGSPSAASQRAAAAAAAGRARQLRHPSVLWPNLYVVLTSK